MASIPLVSCILPQGQNEPAIVTLDPPLRDENSLIFGVPARLTTSGDPRYEWSDREGVFVDWIRNNPEGFERLEDLLEVLDMHGFTDQILDAEGVSVRATIEKKVKSKITRTRAKLATGWRPGQQPGRRPPGGRPAPVDDEPAMNANSGPGNEFIEGWNINIINPDGP